MRLLWPMRFPRSVPGVIVEQVKCLVGHLCERRLVEWPLIFETGLTVGETASRKRHRDLSAPFERHVSRCEQAQHELAGRRLEARRIVDDAIALLLRRLNDRFADVRTTGNRLIEALLAPADDGAHPLYRYTC